MKVIALVMTWVLGLACGGHPPLAEGRRATLHTDDSLVAGVAYSRSGRHVAIAGQTGEIRVWDVSTASLVAKLPDAGRFVVAAPDEETFILLDDRRPRVVAWNWRTSTVRTVEIVDALKAFAPTAELAGLSLVTSIAVSPDGTTLLTVHGRGLGMVAWDLPTRMPTRYIAAAVSAAAFLPDGRRIVGAGTKLAIYDLSSGRETPLHEADAPYDDVVISADGSRAIAARAFGDASSGPSRFDVVSLPDGALLRTIEVAPTSWATPHANMALTNDGTKLLATVAVKRGERASANGAVLFDVVRGMPIRTFTEDLSTFPDDPKHPTGALGLAPDGSSLVLGYRALALF